MSGHSPHHPKGGLPYETQEPNFKIIIAIIPVCVLLVIVYTLVCYFGASTSLSREMVAKQTYGAEMASKKLDAFEAKEDSSMHSYGWMDKKKGMVKIPIDEAMHMMVEKSAPSNASSLKAR
jgi:hypothetical protein